MAEQFAFDQVFTEGGAVYFNKWSVFALAGIVNRRCDQFLTRAGGASHKDCGIAFGENLNSVEDLFHF